MFRNADPFKIFEKINDNAYKLELHPEFGVSPTFTTRKTETSIGQIISVSIFRRLKRADVI
jgi:hypothetical protein